MLYSVPMPTVRLTFEPWRDVSVSDEEYLSLLRQGLIYTGAVVPPPLSFTNAQYDELANPDSEAARRVIEAVGGSELIAGISLSVLATVDERNYAPLADVIPLSQKGSPEGVAELDVGGRLPDSQVPTRLREADLKSTFVAQGQLPLNARAAGAVGDGITDDGAALNAAMAALQTGGGGEMYIPPGVYATSIPLVQPPFVKVQLAQGARILATASMADLWTLSSPNWGTAGDGWAYRGVLRGGVFDCNSLASRGIVLTGFKAFITGGWTVRNFLTDAFTAGTNGTHLSYELYLDEFSVDRDRSIANPTGSRGIVITSTDSRISRGVICGSETGSFNNQPSNRFTDVHVWSWEQSGANLHKWSFVDAKDSALYINCDCDTPLVAGWLLAGSKTSIVNSRVFLNNWASDNVAVGVSLIYSSSAPQFAHIQFVASSAQKLLADISGPGVARPSWLTVTTEPPTDWTVTAPYMLGLGLTVVGVTYSGTEPTTKRLGIVSIASRIQTRRLDVISTYNDLMINAYRGNNRLGWGIADGSTFIEKVSDGGQTRYYIGDQTTETVRIDAATGGIQAGTTAGRGSTLFNGSGAPLSSMGASGDFYLRYDTPTVANQRIYIKVGGAWTGIL